MSPKLELAKSLLSFEDLLKSFFDFFIKEYGEAKAREIIVDVERSDKANRFIADSFRARRRFNHESYVGVIQIGRRFLLKKAEIVCFGSIVLLEKWRAEVGAPVGLAEDGYLKEMFFRIILECDKHKTHITGNPNFFERYFQVMTNALDDFASVMNSLSPNIVEEQTDDKHPSENKIEDIGFRRPIQRLEPDEDDLPF